MALSQAKTQAETSATQNAQAADTYGRYTKTFVPIENKIAADAQGYDTPERRNAEAAQAQADVGSGIDAQRDNIGRDVMSRGGDVNSGNYTAALARAGVVGGAAQGAAGNQARKNVEAIGGAKLADAANLGRGNVSTNATQTQLGLQAGNSAVANANVPGQIGLGQVQGFNQAAGTAIQGNSSAGNLLLGQYNAQTGAQQAANSSGNAIIGAVGTVAGAYAGGLAGGPAGASAGASAGAKFFGSDKNIKEGRKAVQPEVSLAAMRKTPIESWRYKKSAAAGDGGRTRTGAMAQSVNKNFGEVAAPNGKTIDVVTMLGHTMNAVKALDKKVSLSLANAKTGARKRAVA